MRHQTSKFITILIVYVSFFLLPLGLNASINNNLLSSIHAESSNDYYTWSELEFNKKFTESEESYILKKVIVRDWDLNKLPSKSPDFLNNALKGLVNLSKNKCVNIIFNNQNLQSFEVSFLQTFNAWQIQCKNKKMTTNSRLQFEKHINQIDPNFSNILEFNKLAYLYFNDQKEVFKDIYKQVNFEKANFISINFREIYFLKKILKEYEIDSENFNLFINKFYSLLGDELLASYYQIESFQELVFEQAYQLSNYYKTMGRYQDSLALLSILSEIDSNNKDHYLIQKYDLMLNLSRNEKIFILLKEFHSEVEIFNFMKHKLYLQYANSFNIDKQQIMDYFYSISDNFETDLKLNLAFEVSSFLYSEYNLTESLAFLEECCFESINNSQSVEYIFRYGALLEESKRIPEAEQFITKSIEYSGNNPSPIILNYLAYLWVEMDKNLDISENMLIKAVSDTDANNGAILDSLGWLYYKKNNLDIAEKWIHDAYILEPAEPEIIDHLSQVYKKQGRKKESQYLDAKILNFHKDYFKFEQVLNRNYED